jgi:hypothetical protein
MTAERSLAYVVDQACTAQWLAEQGRGELPQDEVPLRPILNLLVEFAEEKLCRAAVREDPRRAMDALCDLRSAVATLVGWGHKEFEPTLQQIDGELLFHAEACRHSLLMNYLDAKTPEKVAELHGMLLELAQTGYWPRLLQDMDDELWRRAFDKIDALQARVG